MIFINIASFLPFALTLFSLDAVTAISVPKSVDSGQLNRRNPGDLTFINYFNVPEGGLLTACGQTITSNFSNIVALPSSKFDGGSHCNKTISISYSAGGAIPSITITANVAHECIFCADYELSVSQDVYRSLSSGSMFVPVGLTGVSSLNY